MKSKTEELESIEKSIIALDNHFKNTQLDSATITRFQTTLDKTAEKVQYDETLGSKRFRLYEMQALIEIAKGNFSRANNFINDARSMFVSGDSFISDVLKEYIENSNNTDDESTDEEVTTKPTKKYNRKLEGWLALYTLRLVVLPLYLLYEAITTANLDTSGFNETFINYISIIIVVDVLIMLLSFGSWYFYFTKKTFTKTLIFVLESSFAAYQFIAGYWLTSLITNYSLESDGTEAKLYWYGIVSIIWLIYWFRSKRVRATFVNQ